MTPGTGPGPRGRDPVSPSNPPTFAELVRLALHSAAARILARIGTRPSEPGSTWSAAGVPWPQAFALSRYWLGP